MICHSCEEDREDVEERHSFGCYAGKFCIPCCSKYQDNCGVNEEQGDPTTLHEFEVGGWDAIQGEPV